MSESDTPTVPPAGNLSPITTARLAGFSSRDAELLAQFLRRPSTAGLTLEVIETDPADLLIANMSQPEAVMAVRRRKQPGRTIGLVQQFTTDAAYYQVQQNAQLLYSLAQGINRLREGWYPPHLTQHAPTAGDASANAVSAPPPAVSSLSTGPSTLLEAVPHVAQAHDDDDVSPEHYDSDLATAAPPAESHHEVAHPSHAAAARGDEALLPWQRSLSILVVDDSKFSRVAIQEALGKVGFNVDTAVDGEEGLRMAMAKVYDVALVDFEMPGIKGPEVLRRMRGMGTNAPNLLIMLTSRTGAVDRLRAKIAGCDAYLTKPTKMSEFVAVLTQFASQGRFKRS